MAGYDASQCRQPFKSRTNIRGANGGHGGDGDGGDGGQGGDALIFYERLSELLNVTLVNNGGRGGKAGEGGHYGGYPCFCSEKSWRLLTVNGNFSSEAKLRMKIKVGNERGTQKQPIVQILQDVLEDGRRMNHTDINGDYLTNL